MRKNALEELKAFNKSLAPSAALFVTNFLVALFVTYWTGNQKLVDAASFLAWAVSAEVSIWLFLKRKSRVVRWVADFASLFAAVSALLYETMAINDQRWIATGAYAVFGIIYTAKHLIVARNSRDFLSS